MTTELPDGFCNYDEIQVQDWVLGRLRDRYAAELESQVRDVISCLKTTAARGWAGLYLAYRAVMRWSVDARPADREECDRLLADAAVRGALFAAFQVPRLDGESCRLTLHRVGTTSCIVRCETDERPPQALKLVHPLWWDNPTISSETTRTKSSLVQRGLEFAPRIDARSSSRSILMDFVDGETLREAMSRVASAPDRVEWVCALIASLCRNLQKLHYEGFPHGDLSPDNVILKRNRPDDAYFIDFGINYVLLDGVATSRRLERAHRYLPPEQRLGSPRPTILGDLYSFAMIVVDVLEPRTAQDEVSPETKLERIGRADPALSGLLETFLDRNPASRAFEMIRDQSGFFESVREELVPHVRTYLTILGRQRAGLWDRLTILLGNSLLPGLDRLRDRMKVHLQDLQGGAHDAARRYLLRWTLLCDVVHVLVLVIFFWRLEHYESEGQLGRALPGLVVALSYSFVATQYYMNLFSGLCVRRLSLRAEVLLRASAFFHAVPILSAMLFRPEWWPFLSAAGALVVTLNNAASHALAHRATRELCDAGWGVPRPPAQEEQLRNFGQWKIFLGIQVGILLVLGFLLQYGVLRDEAAWALLTVIVNLSMFWSRCTVLATGIRGAIDWSCRNLLRKRHWSAALRSAAPVDARVP